jgi:hypothetical protein
MKKLFLLAIITALIATAASAQETKAQGPTRVSYTESELKLKNDLKLSADQSEKYDAIHSAFYAKSQALAQSTTISAEAKRAKMKTMTEEKETKIRELLTPDQLAKYNAILEKTPQEKKPAS